MATINGIGTTRYDWQRRPDGTAEATVWFVLFFFPIMPLRREQLRVVDSGIKRSGVLATLAALLGAGAGFQSAIEILGSVPISPLPILRTYFMGFVIVPLMTLGIPMMLLVGGVFTAEKMGLDPNTVLNRIAPLIGIGELLWVSCFVARILDRSSGRHHVARRRELAKASRAADN